MILTWFSKIRLWEVALSVFLAFSCYFLWRTVQIEENLSAQATATFAAADASITHLNAATDQLAAAVTNVSVSISQTESDVHGLTTQFGGVAVGLQKTVALVNAPCVPGPCGLVSDTAKTLNTTRLTLGQLEIAANNFDKNEDRFYLQEDQLYADSDKSVKDLDALLSSPDLNAAIRNTSTITYNLGQTTTDFQTKFHSFLYPPPCVGWKCHIKGIYEGVRIGSQFAEPAYWSWALFTQIKP